MTLRTQDSNVNKNLLCVKNKHPFDDRIKFQEEGHKYWIDDDDTDLISATTYIHDFFDEFDEETIIKNILNKFEHKYDKNYKYYKMSYDEIKNLWEKNRIEASEAGTKMHALIEYFYNDIEIEIESPEMEQFLQFYEDHEDLEMYRTEWMIFSEQLRITGSIDAVFRNDDGTLTLGDWKRSKEIKFESFGNKKGKFPFQNILDCNFYHYSLQLNLYRVILEKFYNEKIKEMFLVILHPNNKDDKYMKIPVKRMEKEGDLLLDFRINQLLKLGYSKDRFQDININFRLKDEINYGNIDEINEEEEIKPLKRLLKKNYKK